MLPPNIMVVVDGTRMALRDVPDGVWPDVETRTVERWLDAFHGGEFLVQWWRGLQQGQQMLKWYEDGDGVDV